MKSAVFLDRDGTINIEVNYLSSLADLQLIDGAAEGIAMLNRAGIPVAVITNQSGVARGFFSQDFVNKVHMEMAALLDRKGARVDAWYFCPHHPDAGVPPLRKACNCRKPGTALLEQAAKDLAIDVKKSYLVGDSITDMETAWRAGSHSILVLTGHGQNTLARLSGQLKKRIDHIATDLRDACKWIKGRLGK